MSATTPPPPIQQWHHDTPTATYLISTSPALLSHSFINASFADPGMYWAKPLPAPELALMLSHSLTLGLYILQNNNNNNHSPSSPSSPRTPSPTLASDPNTNTNTENDSNEWQQIGLARFTTDHVTFAYLSDVFISPSHRGDGLGAWLVACCGEVMDGMPFLRRAMLMASREVGKEYYGKVFGMQDVGEFKGDLVCMSKKGRGSGLVE